LFFLYSFFFAMLFFLCSWAADFCVRGAAAMLCGRGWRARPEQLQVVTASAAAAQRLTAASPASAGGRGVAKQPRAAAHAGRAPRASPARAGCLACPVARGPSETGAAGQATLAPARCPTASKGAGQGKRPACVALPSSSTRGLRQLQEARVQS